MVTYATAKSMGFVSSPPPYLMLAPSTGLLVSTALETGVNYASGGSGILDITVSAAYALGLYYFASRNDFNK